MKNFDNNYVQKDGEEVRQIDLTNPNTEEGNKQSMLGVITSLLKQNVKYLDNTLDATTHNEDMTVCILVLDRKEGETHNLDNFVKDFELIN